MCPFTSTHPTSTDYASACIHSAHLVALRTVGPGGPGGPALPLVPTPTDRRREVCVAQAISVQGHENTWGMQIHTVIYIELCIEVELLTFCCPTVHANMYTLNTFQRRSCSFCTFVYLLSMDGPHIALEHI